MTVGTRTVQTPLATRVGAGLVVVGVLVAGIFVWGRVAPTDVWAMALTAVWFAAVLAVGFLLVRRRRALWLPTAGGYAITAAAALVLLGLPMVRDRQVDEQVVTAAPAPATQAPPTEAPTIQPATPTPEPPPADVELSRGAFAPLAHPGAGTAAVVRLADGGHVLTLTGFSTDDGPDLRVYLTTGDPIGGGDIGEFVDLGALKGNVGDQQYDIPAEIDPSRYPNAVIWCRAFAVGFTSAPLG